MDRPQDLFWRAFSEKLNRHVLLKVLRAEFPSAEQIAGYEAEYELLKDALGEGIPRAHELLAIDKARVLVLEGFQGRSLSQEIKNLTLRDKTRIAFAITKALANLHANGIIHRGLKPENILIDLGRDKVQIIDFSLALKAEKIAVGDRLVGTLQYISPEQTGRTQNAVDYRSDYYSLGVTMYELFAESLPFHAADEMEWVHSHIAVAERPLHVANSQIPLAISMIVQKLMKKAPEERYQSGLGILSDLERCLKEENPSNFQAGLDDVSSQFRLSTKLYGRESEIQLVEDVLANVVRGNKRLILVNGEAGVGKSSLMNVVKESTRAFKGYFIFGKFDQFRKEIPFSALIQAFHQLVAQILTEDESQIQAWKEEMTEAMGENASIVTNILPQVELIIGKMPPVQPLQGNEQKQRFQETFHAFIRACCKPGRPLVIFLDDLQWADSASRNLMQMFLTGSKAESMLFVGSYRDGEITPSHPLHEVLNFLAENKIHNDEIHLSNLSLDDVLALLSDSFPVSTADREILARLVHGKTNGNPFFISQFLKALYEKRLLRFDPFSGWTWDHAKIQSEDVTSNVLDLLTEKIARLPKATQETLQLAACFGNEFKLDDLKIYNQKPDSENSKRLDPAAAAGLLSHGSTGAYKFIHDRVQEAAYGMITTDMRSEIHHQIAQRLLSTWSREKISEDVFSIVNHLNAGQSCIKTVQEREAGAELNLLAAQRAKDSSVYDVALNYAVAGISILASDDWLKYERLLKPLMILQAICEYAISHYENAERIFQTVLSKVSTKIEKAQIYRIMVDLAHVQDRNVDAIKLCMTGLKLFGIKMPRNPNKVHLMFMLLHSRRILRQRMQSSLSEKTEPPTEEEREVMGLLAVMSAPAYILNKNLLAYVCMKMVMISIRGGYLDLGARCLFNVYLWYGLGDFETTSKSVDGLQTFITEHDPKTMDLKALFGLQVFAMHLVKPYKETIKALDRSYHLMVQNGNIMYAANTGLGAAILILLTEHKLERTAQKLALYFDKIKNGNYGLVTCSVVELAVKNWRGIEDSELTDANLNEQFRKQTSPMSRSWYVLTRMVSSVLRGEYEKGFAEIKDYEAALATVPFTALSINSRVLSSVARLKNISRLTGLTKIKQVLKVRSDLNFFKNLSTENPKNFKAAYLILRSQWDVMRGRFRQATENLSAAILAAEECEIVFYKPLANQLLAEVYFMQRMDSLGWSCIRDAFFLYENWGAAGIASAMIERYPELSETLNPGVAQALDINTVLKATNALISEVEMSRLVQKMLNILLENAGAERAVLFLMENQELVVRGEITVHSRDDFQLKNTKITDYVDVPHTMISYVARTSKPIVVGDAQSDDRLNSDEYVRRSQVLSGFFLPILSQGELRGMVYLENNSAKAAFTPDCVELMTILSGQIALSLENARLYQQQGEAIRMQNELITAHAVQEMLFPPLQFECDGAHLSGYYQPATECGGDWWSYSQIGDWLYCYIGDATGHGAPAALVTSAACSAVSLIEAHDDITPEKAMALLNHAVCRATKGQITMTFFVGALNRLTGELRYVRASHDPAMLIRKQNLVENAGLRASFEPLMGTNGLPLGAATNQEYQMTSVFLQPGDRVLFYTDGLLELVGNNGKFLGERGFLQAVYSTCINHFTANKTALEIVEKLQTFRQDRELKDDITFCVLEYKGAVAKELDQSAA